jgi:catechol-2,3-dioxygenase
MRRLHVHVSVGNLADSIRFYSILFGVAPSVERTDYAKWMLADPPVNFAISDRSQQLGLDHLGIQVDNREELAEIAGRLKAAQQVPLEQKAAACCYAVSDKAWTSDPQGVAWETFYTHGDATVYGDDSVRPADIPRAARQPAQSESTPNACCAR